MGEIMPKGVGISKGMFVAGIIIAILASSLLSTVIASQLVVQGPKGDKGDTGDTGPQGIQGIPGEGISLISAYADDMIDIDTIAPRATNIPDMFVTVTLNKSSSLVIMFKISSR